MLGKIKLKVIHEDEKETHEKFYCSICNYPLLTMNDFYNSELYDACNDCYVTFIEARRDTWKKGIRPKQEIIDNYLVHKKLLYEKTGEKSEF